MNHYCSLLCAAHIFVSIVSRSLSIMNGKEVKHCSLCFHNGEPEEFYRWAKTAFVLGVACLNWNLDNISLMIAALTTWRPATAEWWLVQCCASLSATSVVPRAMLLTLSGCYFYLKLLSSVCCITLCRYCPLNKDGAFSYGASLPQLKTRRNAAGNFSSRRFSSLNYGRLAVKCELSQDALPPTSILL